MADASRPGGRSATNATSTTATTQPGGKAGMEQATARVDIIIMMAALGTGLGATPNAIGKDSLTAISIRLIYCTSAGLSRMTLVCLQKATRFIDV